MTRINLYPWREELEEQQKKQFIILISAICLMTIVVMFIVNMIYASYIKNQTENNQYINNELTKINQQIQEIEQLKTQKDALVSRLAVIQKIEHDRYGTLTLFNEIINLINPLIVLNEIKRTENLVKITGAAESNTEVAKFLRALDVSPNFRQAELNQIRVEENTGNGSNMSNQNQNQTRALLDSSVEEQTDLNHHFELQCYQVQSESESESEINKEEKINKFSTESVSPVPLAQPTQPTEAGQAGQVMQPREI